MPSSLLSLYEEHFVVRDFERLDLFALLVEKYGVRSALYPGSWIHVTPSFMIPSVSYVDTDRRARRFFAYPALPNWIAARQRYDRPAEMAFHAQDYREPIPEPDQRFDLLISQWAGFLSDACARYLRIGGLLLANNSHGDAGLAHLDERFRLVAVVHRRKGRHTISERNLDGYFDPKKALDISRQMLIDLGKGLGYRKSAAHYVFERVT